MFAYCNNSPITTLDYSGQQPFASLMLTDSGHFLWPDPDPELEVEFQNDDGSLHEFYDDNIKNTIEQYYYNGTIKSVIVRYDGLCHAATGWERFAKGILELGATESVCYIVSKYSAFPLSIFFDVISITAEAIKSPDIRGGDYKCYTAIVSSEYTDPYGTTYFESVFFNYYVNGSSFYRFTETWRTPVDPSQVYYWP